MKVDYERVVTRPYGLLFREPAAMKRYARTVIDSAATRLSVQAEVAKMAAG